MSHAGTIDIQNLNKQYDVKGKALKVLAIRDGKLDATMGVFRQQATQRAQDLVSIRAKREQATQSYNLTARELEMTRPLAKSGAISDVELLRLERDVARYRGERDSASSDIPRLESAVLEANRKIQEVELKTGLWLQLVERRTAEGGLVMTAADITADLEAALNAAVPTKFANAGQVCVTADRFFIHESLHDAFVTGFVERTRAIKLGDGIDSLIKINVIDGAAHLEYIAAEVIEEQLILQGSIAAVIDYRSAGNRG